MHIKTTIEEVKAYRSEMHERSMALIAKKGADYNRDQQLGGDTLFNLSVCELLGVVPTAERGILVRLCDKFMRLVSLMDPDRLAAVSDEDIEKTIEDIHNYVDYAGLIRRKRLATMVETTRDVDTGVDNEPPTAIDTPANSEAVEREDGPVVRCFEYTDNPSQDDWLYLVKCRNGFCTHAYDGNGKEMPQVVGRDYESFSEKGRVAIWPAEWDAKVAAVKANANNPPVVPPAPPHNAEVAPEWPKWTMNSSVVRIWRSEHSALMHKTCDGDPEPWEGSDGERYSQYSKTSSKPITRAEAVLLIGEAAVLEGERLAGLTA